MPMWLQHLLVLIAVAGCLVFVGRQAFQALRGRKSRLGQCCAKGCGAVPPPNQPKTERVVFFPVEMLGRTRK